MAEITRYAVRRDGFIQAVYDTENQAFHGLLSLQGNSVHHATRYEGWAITPLEGSDMKEHDVNLAVLKGRLATDPEARTFDSGGRQLRFLVTVESQLPRRRVDVVPVIWADPPDDIWDAQPLQGARVWVTGAVQRRAVEGPEGRRSLIQVVADQVVEL